MLPCKPLVEKGVLGVQVATSAGLETRSSSQGQDTPGTQFLRGPVGNADK